jgi:hypothetical protein
MSAGTVFFANPMSQPIKQTPIGCFGETALTSSKLQSPHIPMTPLTLKSYQQAALDALARLPVPRR